VDCEGIKALSTLLYYNLDNSIKFLGVSIDGKIPRISIKILRNAIPR